MTLEEAIENCELVVAACRMMPNLEGNDESSAKHRQLAEWLKELKKRREQGVLELEPHWIPCSKRLPEEDGTYIVSGVWESGKKQVGECNFQVDDGYFDTSWNFDVKAWMPMLEPYKEGNK